jgi:drug/metabolite transporter (DMT)-like permease
VQVFALFTVSTFCFASMLACIKGLGEYPIVGTVFFRNFISWLVVIATLIGTAKLGDLRTTRVLDHFLRGLLGASSMWCIFAAYRYLPMAEASAIGHSQPIFLAVLSVALLGERSIRHRWIGVGAGFLGVVIMLNPHGAGMGLGSALALAGALLSAFAMIMVRRLGRTESSGTVVFYFMAWGSVVTGALLPFYWRTPTPWEATLLIATGVFGAVGQLLMVQGYRIGEASLVASLNYLQLLWSALLGFFIWSEVPRTPVVVGVAIILASQVFMIRAESRLTT